MQPYERANITVGYEVSTGSRFREKLSVLQIARMKMPRQMFLPQSRVIEKAARISLLEDTLENLPAVPALAGGSFLDGAELAYSRFSAAWVGLVGQRVQDSINESLLEAGPEADLYSEYLSIKGQPIESVISRLRPKVDLFFDKVLVNAPDERVRLNRLTLLKELLAGFSTIADFSEIVTNS